MALVSLPEIQALDPYYDKVVLLLPGNGTNGSDASLTKTTVVGSGNVQLSAAQSKFGGASYYFAGGHLRFQPYAGINFALGDFTVEAWMMPADVSHYMSILITGTQNNSEFEFRMGATGFLQCYVNGGVNNTLGMLQASTACSPGVFQHVAVTCAGGVYRLFLAGIVVATSGTTSGTMSITNPVGTPSIGGWVANSIADFNGYLDDLRITKGVARYTENFTPPVAEFPWLGSNLLGARAFNANVSRRICAPARALSAGGPVTTAFDDKLAQRNTYFGGTGQLTGTVKEKMLPANVPLHRRVCLLDEKTRLLVAETWSDATTGNYLFERIDPTRTYTVMSYDHTGLYRAVIADAQVPEAMP